MPPPVAPPSLTLPFRPKNCSFSDPSTIHVITRDNRVHAPGADAYVEGCHGKIDMRAWLKLGVDRGTTIGDEISSAVIMQMGAKLLGFAS